MAAAAAPSMPYQTLGRSGLLVSRLSFGSWVTFSNQVGTDDAYSLMKSASLRDLLAAAATAPHASQRPQAAYAAGVNRYDNAEVPAAATAAAAAAAAQRPHAPTGIRFGQE